MLNLLNEEQQQIAKDKLVQMIDDFLAQNKHIYVVLEPELNDEIKHIFMRLNADYSEPFLLFDTQFEQVGPRIAQLGINQKFDNWIIEKAFFERWTALFVTNETVQLDTFVQQIAYLCNAITFEHLPVIFRCYTPTILNEWLGALQQDNLSQSALGCCSEIIYAGDIPGNIGYGQFDQNGDLTIKIKNLLTNEESIKIPPNSPSSTSENEVHTHSTKWLITENQQASLQQARMKYVVHKIRQEILLTMEQPSLEEIIDIHKRIIYLINLCFQSQILDTFLMSELTKLYIYNIEIWDKYQNQIRDILQLNEPEESRVDKLGTFLRNTERNK